MCLSACSPARVRTSGASPLGRLLDVETGTTKRSVDIVGVVADNRTGPLPQGSRPDPAVYTALLPTINGPFTITIGTPNVDAVRADLQAIVKDLDPRRPWLSIRRGEENYLTDAQEMRQMALVLAGLRILAVTLAATGLYAVMGYVVTLRRREIGVRMAIGAEPRQILRMILRQAFRLVLTGGLAGLALSVPLSLGLRAMFVVSVLPLDPVALLATLLLLLGVSLLAVALPARAASRVDPMTTLRQD